MNTFPHAIILLATLLAADISCTRETSVPEDGPQKVDFFIGGTASRATGLPMAGEAQVNRWALFLVREGQTAIEARAHNSDGTGITLDLHPGTYTAYAVANYPTSGEGVFNPDSPATVADLTGTVSLLKDNTATNLVMSGDRQVTVTAGQTGGQGIPVLRLVAKLGIRKITVDFSDNPALAMQTFTLRAIYVTNAYARSTFGTDYTAEQMEDTPSYWHNRMGLASEPAADGLLAETGLDIPIGTNGGSHTAGHWFYCYQNPVLPGADTQSAVWSKRCTRMVIEARVGGTTYYYPITVASDAKGILRNNTYIAEEVLIRRVGSTDPEGENPGAVSVTWSAEVDGWDQTFTVNEIS